MTGLDSWADEVFQALWDEMEFSPPERPASESTIEGQERTAIGEFIGLRGRDFVGRDELTEALLELACRSAEDAELRGAGVLGEAGIGKSALFAHLALELQKDESIFLLGACGKSRKIRMGRIDPAQAMDSGARTFS